MTRSNKDINGVFTTISFYDKNLILRKTSILSQSGSLPNLYDIRTITYYDETGNQIKQISYTLSYDINDDLIEEIII